MNDPLDINNKNKTNQSQTTNDKNSIIINAPVKLIVLI